MAESTKGAASASAQEEQQQPQKQHAVVRSKYSRRVVLSTILGRSDQGVGLAGERVVVGGWVKSCKEITKKDETGQSQQPASPLTTDVSCSEVLMTRVPLLRSLARLLAGALPHKLDTVIEKPISPSVAFLRINDGSCTASIQIIIDSSVIPLVQVTPVGTSIMVEGMLKKPSTPAKHIIELKVEKVLHIGTVDPSKYPLTKTRLSFDFLRLHSHLRPRTITIASITRIRNALSHSTHAFFQSNGFIHVEMPVITPTTGEDNNKMFHVTTLFGKSDSMKEMSSTKDRDAISLERVKTAIREKSIRIEELERSNSNSEALAYAHQDLKKAKELASELEEQLKKSVGPSMKMEKLDFSKDYFSRPVYLSKSAELHLESYACALSSVYTLGPTFQAEKSQSKKHLAEMWVLDVSMAFAELEDAMNCAEDYLKYLCQTILGNSSNDIKFASKRLDKNCVARIQSVGSSQFERITYTDAVEALNKDKQKTFKTKAEWGYNLSEEHESYLANEIYKRPTIIYDHPKNLKPFFMRLKDDSKTVSSFDIILPRAGALIRGGQKEERIDMITKRIQELGLPKEEYEWYLDLRRHGTVRQSGFSLGLEHMVMFVTGIDDARDVIPFPRAHGSAHP